MDKYQHYLDEAEVFYAKGEEIEAATPGSLMAVEAFQRAGAAATIATALAAKTQTRKRA